MARRIRDFDWKSHPFGPPEQWPQSLKSALSICLHSAFPTAIYWGSELRLLYNDAWAPIPGPRHPAALGAPAREVWADIWHVLEPQLVELIETGEGLSVRDQLLPMRRYGSVEETYWNYSFTPIRGEDGAIVGVFNSGSETTETVLAQRRMRFLLELGEALRGTSSPQAACGTAVEMLGRHLGVQCCGFCEIDPNDTQLEVTCEWTSDGMESIGAKLDLALLAPLLDPTLHAGRVLRIEDLTDERAADARIRQTFAAAGVRAALVVPRTEAGRLVAALVLHSDVPRVWTDAATVLAEQVLERTWRWMERERALERERMMAREIDHRARNALAVVQSLVRQTRADAIDEFREKLDDRIAALARAHGLLSDERWTAVDLGALIQQELDPYLAGDRPRVRLKGRKLPLPPPLAQSMALVLHELTTNAVKHGALADDGGQLEIAWQADGSGDLIIDWCEMAGRTIAPGDAQREGFGSVLFASVIERQLRGRIDRTWASDGLQCRISIPATDARADEVAQDDVSERPPTGAIRVLLAEDEAIVALDVATMIEDLGYDLVRVCYTLDEALAAVAEEDLEVAVLDANLGGRSSMPVAELLHGRGVPVIFATGYQEMPDLPDALQGAPRLTKPVSRAMLAAALEQTLPATS